MDELKIEVKECKGCENYNGFENKCLITGDKCYEKGECLIHDCKNYEQCKRIRIEVIKNGRSMFRL